MKDYTLPQLSKFIYIIIAIVFLETSLNTAALPLSSENIPLNPTLLKWPEYMEVLAKQLEAQGYKSYEDRNSRGDQRIPLMNSLSSGNRNLIYPSGFVSSNKRNLDPIDNVGFHEFKSGKRNIDEIDRIDGFSGFNKRNMDEIDRSSGFPGFNKRHIMFDEIDNNGLQSLAKRSIVTRPRGKMTMLTSR